MAGKGCAPLGKGSKAGSMVKGPKPKSKGFVTSPAPLVKKGK